MDQSPWGQIYGEDSRYPSAYDYAPWPEDDLMDVGEWDESEAYDGGWDEGYSWY